jgi:hypothetical protein
MGHFSPWAPLSAIGVLLPWRQASNGKRCQQRSGATAKMWLYEEPNPSPLALTEVQALADRSASNAIE